VCYYCKCDGEEHEVNVENKYDNDDSKFAIIRVIIIVIISMLTITTTNNVLN